MIKVLASLTLTAAFLADVESALAGMCFDLGSFRANLDRNGETVRYSSFVQVSATDETEIAPFYIAIASDGSWTAYWTLKEVLACPVAVGRAWTDQTIIPPDELPGRSK